VFITVRVSLDLKSPATAIVLTILFTPMLAAIAQRPGVQGWALKATSIRGTRQLMGNHFVLFFWSLALYYADTVYQAVSGTRRPNIIWWVQSFLWVTTVSTDRQLKSTKVTLHSHHTSSLHPSKEVGSTPWPENIWDTSDQRRFFGGCNSTTIFDYSHLWNISVTHAHSSSGWHSSLTGGGQMIKRNTPEGLSYTVLDSSFAGVYLSAGYQCTRHYDGIDATLDILLITRIGTDGRSGLCLWPGVYSRVSRKSNPHLLWDPPSSDWGSSARGVTLNLYKTKRTAMSP
jgi:hypothetical protein